MAFDLEQVVGNLEEVGGKPADQVPLLEELGKPVVHMATGIRNLAEAVADRLEVDRLDSAGSSTRRRAPYLAVAVHDDSDVHALRDPFAWQMHVALLRSKV